MQLSLMSLWTMPRPCRPATTRSSWKARPRTWTAKSAGLLLAAWASHAGRSTYDELELGWADAAWVSRAGCEKTSERRRVGSEQKRRRWSTSCSATEAMAGGAGRRED
jgi:hypothetical protein